MGGGDSISGITSNSDDGDEDDGGSGAYDDDLAHNINAHDGLDGRVAGMNSGNAAVTGSGDDENVAVVVRVTVTAKVTVRWL